MTVLIGIYLLQVQPIDLGSASGKPKWAASWTLLRSPSGRRDDWEPLVQHETPSPFTDEAEACGAAMEQGLDFARRLQGDDGLEPTLWNRPVPVSLSWPMLRKRAYAIH